MNFLKNILSTLIALVIFSLATLFIFLGIISSMSDKGLTKVESNSVLHIKLNKPITELEVDNPFDEISFLTAEQSSIGLVQLKQVLNNAANDEKISGIYLEVSMFMGGMASLAEVRAAFDDFRNSGKFIVTYSEYYTEGAYYLASVADEVLLNPGGVLDLNGLNANVTFYKGMLDKLGIEAQIFRVGDFKSAVEPFIRKDLSEEGKLQLSEQLNDLNNNMLKSISESRNIELEKLRLMSKIMEVRSGEDALKFNLIDGLAYNDEVLSKIKLKTQSEEVNLISYNDYKKSFSTFKLSDNEIAVIVASGEIVMGKGSEETIGSEKFLKEIRKARESDKVKAIVIRINSPGGAALASDVLWREIKLAADKKPVIASMSDYAASGGYYMAMACDTIVAQPNTITGSIGIFGMLFNLETFLEDKIGITHDEVQTGEYSGMMTVTRGLTDAEKAIIQNNVEKNYETFIAKAAEGRGMTIEAIKAVASGRVWTGGQAKDNGLVDILGSFDDAIAIAANKADISADYKVRYYPERKPFFEKLINDFENEAHASMIKSELGEFYPYFNKAKKLNELRGIQARIPFEMEIN